MRGRIYLLSLLVAVGGAVFFATQGHPVLAVLAVVPGYFVVAYVLILVATFLPGGERRRFEAARADAFPSTPALPGDTPLHPAFMGSVLETMYSGDGFLGWPDSGDLVFRALVHPSATFSYPPSAFRGFKVQDVAPPFLDAASLVTPDRGPVVVLDGGPEAMMVQVWVRPDDAASFADRLRAAGVPDLA